MSSIRVVEQIFVLLRLLNGKISNLLWSSCYLPVPISQNVSYIKQEVPLPIKRSPKDRVSIKSFFINLRCAPKKQHRRCSCKVKDRSKERPVKVQDMLSY